MGTPARTKEAWATDLAGSLWEPGVSLFGYVSRTLPACTLTATVMRGESLLTVLMAYLP